MVITKRYCRFKTFQLSILAGLTLASCGGSGGADPTPVAPVEMKCSDLVGISVPASSIGLPTGGAVVTAATLVPAGGTSAQPYSEYCKVSAAINPIDPAAPKIMMSLGLPTNWNSKMLMFGGGGFNGVLSDPARANPAGAVDKLTALGRGYATFSGDSGHQSANTLGGFALNDEALRNFSYEALKKTRDAALFIVQKRYGVLPRLSYFVGSSTGGREGLAMAQKWPKDFNAILALWPAYNAASLDLQFGRMARALAAPGAYSNQAKRQALHDAVMQTCDQLDGVVDGLVSNQAACNASFDPMTAQVNSQPLRCAGGADVADSCLSDAQIAAFKTLNTPVVFNFPMASGENQYPGFNAWGADWGRAGTGINLTITALGLGTIPPAYPFPAYLQTTGPTPPFSAGFWDQWVKYFVTKDPNFNSLSLDPENPGPWQSRISELSGMQDINNADLTAFANNGGRLIMAHGLADQVVSTRATEQYYNRVRAFMGAPAVDKFMRFFEFPGWNHGSSAVFSVSWDGLGMLEDWIEKGTPPTGTYADTFGRPGRTRPLCNYPTWPKYVGSGNADLASSFVCASN